MEDRGIFQNNEAHHRGKTCISLDRKKDKGVSGSMFSFLFIYEDVRVCIKQRCINRKNKRSFKERTFTEFSIDGKEYYLKNKMDKIGKTLFRALKISEPAHITAKEEFGI